jgi:sterol desaturase/sphingolipid hydroxylase (fatty acid hydroxylase superfamily)
MGLLFDPSRMTTGLAILVFQMPGYFIHLNSRIRFGASGRIFACPQTHRVHHSIEPRHYDQNFAAVFSLWDSLFGTYYHPAKDEWPETGVVGRTVSSVPQAIVLPFITWAGMLRRRPKVSSPGGDVETAV